MKKIALMVLFVACMSSCFTYTQRYLLYNNTAYDVYVTGNFNQEQMWGAKSLHRLWQRSLRKSFNCEIENKGKRYATDHVKLRDIPFEDGWVRRPDSMFVKQVPFNKLFTNGKRVSPWLLSKPAEADSYYTNREILQYIRSQNSDSNINTKSDWERFHSMASFDSDSTVYYTCDMAFVIHPKGYLPLGYRQYVQGNPVRNKDVFFYSWLTPAVIISKCDTTVLDFCEIHEVPRKLKPRVKGRTIKGMIVNMEVNE